MLKIVVALILLAHGIGHSMGIIGVLGVASVNRQWDGRSWLLSGATGTTASNLVGIALWAVAMVGFILLEPTRKPTLNVRLPADVRPSLREARADEERLRRDGCLAFERVTMPRRCVYGDPKGAFTVALVGDSHAAQWFPAVSRLAKERHWRILTFVKVACPFVDMPVRNLVLKREYTECAAYRKATIARLREIRPGLTLVSNSRFAIHPVLARDTTVAAQGAALARILERIPGLVAVVVDTPDAGRDVPSCLSRHADDVRRCAVSRSVAYANSLGRRERLATKATGDELIDLTKRVCRANPCPVVVDGMIVFRDARHLTATFSRSLAPDLGEAIKRIL